MLEIPILVLFCCLDEGPLISVMQPHLAKMFFPLVIKVLIQVVYQHQVRVLLHRCFLLLWPCPILHYKDLPVWSLAVTCHRHLFHLHLAGSLLLYSLSNHVLFLFLTLMVGHYTSFQGCQIQCSKDIFTC